MKRVTVKETQWSQPEVHISEKLTAEELATVEEKIKVLDKLLAKKVTAKYKLEVMFGEDRSFHKPFPGMITWWDSGSKLHGGGDSKLYLCPQRMLKLGTCERFINDAMSGPQFVVCVGCGTRWRHEQLIGETFCRLDMPKWAEALELWFRRLDLDADIRIKYARQDIRTAARLEQERNRGGELLMKARDPNVRATAVYPLGNLIKDMSAGASIRQRLLAFLKA